MKKLYTIFVLLCLSMTIYAQQAILLVKSCIGEESEAVSKEELETIESELRNALSLFDGFYADIHPEVYRINLCSKRNIDLEMRIISTLTDADYLCVPTLTKSEANFYLEAYLIHLKSGKMSSPASCYGELYGGKIANTSVACQSLTKELLEGISDRDSLHPSLSEEDEIAYMLQHPQDVQLYKVDPSWLDSFPITNKCGENMSLVHEGLKNKDMQFASKFWYEVYYNCPNYNKAIYTDGESLLRWKIETASSGLDRKKYIDLLMETYDKRLFFFGNDERYPKPYILGKKGLSLYEFSSTPKEKVLAYFLLKNAVDGMREKCPVIMLATYYDVSEWIFKHYPMHQSTFDADFKNVKMYLQREEDAKYYGDRVLQSIERRYNALRNVDSNSEDEEIVIEAPVLDPSELDEEEEVIFFVVEEQPEFPGGQDSLLNYINTTFRYPAIAIENGIQGLTICQYTIETDGSITDVEVIRSSGDDSLDREAVRILKSMPKWKPGTQRGRPTRVTYTMSFPFRLQ